MVLTRRLTLPVWSLTLVAAFAALGGGLATYVRTSGYGVPTPLTGTVTAVNDDATAVGFRPDGQTGDGYGLEIGTRYWVDRDGRTFGGDTTPGCLQPGTFGQRVQLGVVSIRRGSPGPDKLVVWVRCLA
jgi:hypothetical protein